MSLSPQESLRGSKLPEFATSSSFVMSSGRLSPPPPRQRVGVNAISPRFLPKALTDTRSSASFMRYLIVDSSASRPWDSRDTLDTSVSDLIHHWLQHSVPLRGCFRVRNWKHMVTARTREIRDLNASKVNRGISKFHLHGIVTARTLSITDLLHRSRKLILPSPWIAVSITAVACNYHHFYFSPFFSFLFFFFQSPYRSKSFERRKPYKSIIETSVT